MEALICSKSCCGVTLSEDMMKIEQKKIVFVAFLSDLSLFVRCTLCVMRGATLTLQSSHAVVRLLKNRLYSLF